MHFVAALDRVPGMRCVLGLPRPLSPAVPTATAAWPSTRLRHCEPGLGNGLAKLHNARRARTRIVNIVGDHATPTCLTRRPKRWTAACATRASWRWRIGSTSPTKPIGRGSWPPSTRPVQGLDALVNNAGIIIRKPLMQRSKSEWDKAMNVNFAGVILRMKHCRSLLAASSEERRDHFLELSIGLVGQAQKLVRAGAPLCSLGFWSSRDEGLLDKLGRKAALQRFPRIPSEPTEDQLERMEKGAARATSGSSAIRIARRAQELLSQGSCRYRSVSRTRSQRLERIEAEGSI
jgi:short subunit dehydrogenase